MVSPRHEVVTWDRWPHHGCCVIRGRGQPQDDQVWVSRGPELCVHIADNTGHHASSLTRALCILSLYFVQCVLIVHCPVNFYLSGMQTGWEFWFVLTIHYGAIITPNSKSYVHSITNPFNSMAVSVMWRPSLSGIGMYLVTRDWTTGCSHHNNKGSSSPWSPSLTKFSFWHQL